MNVREASRLMGAGVDAVSAELFDKEIKDFSIDSRSVDAGELFFQRALSRNGPVAECARPRAQQLGASNDGRFPKK